MNDASNVRVGDMVVDILIENVAIVLQVKGRSKHRKVKVLVTARGGNGLEQEEWLAALAQSFREEVLL